MYVILAMFER